MTFDVAEKYFKHPIAEHWQTNEPCKECDRISRIVTLAVDLFGPFLDEEDLRKTERRLYPKRKSGSSSQAS